MTRSGLPSLRPNHRYQTALGSALNEAVAVWSWLPEQRTDGRGALQHPWPWMDELAYEVAERPRPLGVSRSRPGGCT